MGVLIILGNTTPTEPESIIERIGADGTSGATLLETYTSGLLMGAGGGATGGGGRGLTSIDDLAYTLLFLEPYLCIYKISTKTQHLNWCSVFNPV